MDNPTLLNTLKVPNAFRDVLVMLGGLISIISLQFIIGIDFFSKFDVLKMGRVEKDFILLLSAFFFGKFLRIFADLVLEFYISLMSLFTKIFLQDGQFNFRSRVHSFLKNLKQNWKKNTREELSLNKEKSLDRKEVENEIGIVETAGALKKYPSLVNDFERMFYAKIFLEIVFSTSFILGVLVSYYYFIISIIFFYLLLSILKEISQHDYLIFRSIVKLSKDNKEQG